MPSTKTNSTATPDSTAASGMRVIKKYPNRRLYDSATSTYVTLAQVKDLVMQGERFVVLDAKTSEDLTRSLLLQIILEEETAGKPLFSEAMLANMIRFYGHTMQGLMGKSLEHMMQQFMDMQAQMTQAASVQPTLNPAINPFATYMEQSQQAMKTMQTQWLAALGVKS